MLDYILFFGYFSIFIFLIFRCRFFKRLPFSPFILSVVFLLKLLAGLALLWIYSHYYSDRLSSDVLKYFDDSKALFKAFQTGHYVDFFKMVTGIRSSEPELMKYYQETEFWFKDFNYHLYNDNRTVIRFNALALIFSHGSLYIHTLFMAFLSFIGETAIFKVFFRFFKKKKYELLVAVFLIPSVIFWTSGVLKEGILMFALGIFVFGIIKLSENSFKPKTITSLIFGLFLLAVTKFYILVALIPGIFTFLWIKKFPRFGFVKFLATHLMFLIIIGINPIPKFNFVEITAQKQHDFINMVEAMGNVNSYYQIPRLEPSVWSMLKNSPIALFNSIFRPLPSDLHSVIMLLPFLENIFLLVLLILLIFYHQKLSEEFSPYLFFIISFSAILLILVGLTTPVIGALVRYKVPVLPFLFILIFYFLDSPQIIKKITKPFLKKK